MDDGSTDGGENVVKPFLGDMRHFLSQNNVGVAVARNRGVEATKSAFLAFFDNKKKQTDGQRDFSRGGQSAGANQTTAIFVTVVRLICRTCRTLPEPEQ